MHATTPAPEWPTRARRIRTGWAALGVVACVYLVYVVSPVKVQTDSIWTIPTVASLLSEGNANLDEYAPTLKAFHDHAIERIDGHAYSYFPLGPSLVALPLVGGFDGFIHLVRGGLGGALPGWAAKGIARWETHFHAKGTFDIYFFDVTELLVASFFTALAIGFLFLTARRRVGLVPSLAVAFIAAFATMAYSTASRSLWQHGPSICFLAAAIWLLTAPERTRRSFFLLGVAVACAYVIRPTNSITAVAFTVYLAVKERRLLPYFLGGATLVAIPFCAYDLSLYGALLPPYFLGSRLSPSAHFFEALAGNLVSPARGLLVWSPILLVGLVDLARRLRPYRLEPVELLFAIILLTHWLVISSFPHWWGGDCVGPRFFTDMVPYLAFFLIRPIAKLLSTPRARPVWTSAVAALAACSLFTNGTSAFSYRVFRWNGTPTEVDRTPSRLWSWTDPPFLRPFRPVPARASTPDARARTRQ